MGSLALKNECALHTQIEEGGDEEGEGLRENHVEEDERAMDYKDEGLHENHVQEDERAMDDEDPDEQG